jgi:DNA segregation ATPase FtsK/SpoIIIE-like protein
MSYQIIFLNDPDQERISIETIEALNMVSAIEEFINNYGVNATQILAIMLVNE